MAPREPQNFVVAGTVWTEIILLVSGCLVSVNTFLLNVVFELINVLVKRVRLLQWLIFSRRIS